jgi:putative restriction endonuclease
MAFTDVNDPNAVRLALKEFDEIGQKLFLKKYGFGKARDYRIVAAGKRYDSKAIFGAAHGYQFPELGPLPWKQFSGGALTVERALAEMGFVVEGPNGIAISGKRASNHLVPGEIYTRESLRGIFATQDATINTGVFRPAGFNSLFLFVTESKTADRTQYIDSLDGDTMHWQGQSAGRTDLSVIEHRPRGLEILVFFRKRKYEYEGAGFRYEGPFEYVSHQGASPSTFILQRANAEMNVAQRDAEASGSFDLSSVEDAREKTMAGIVRRQGQPAFRRSLLKAYQGCCAITGCNTFEVLEAAHIVPYQGPQTNHVTNGLLLRADLHTLFDLGLITVDPTTKVIVVAPTLRASEYGELHGRPLRLPLMEENQPNEQAIRLHYLKSGLIC